MILYEIRKRPGRHQLNAAYFLQCHRYLAPDPPPQDLRLRLRAPTHLLRMRRGGDLARGGGTGGGRLTALGRTTDIAEAESARDGEYQDSHQDREERDVAYGRQEFHPVAP